MNENTPNIPCKSLLGLATALLLASCSSAPPPEDLESAARFTAPVHAAAEPVDSAIHNRINAYRNSLGLRALQRQPELDELARQHSLQMMMHAQGNKGSKISHDGFMKRAFVAETRLGISHFAENVIYASNGQGDPSGKLVSGWLGSKGHHRNIKTAKWSVTGIGVARDDQGRLWATQLFGTAPDPYAGMSAYQSSTSPLPQW